MPLDTRILLMGQPPQIENHLDNMAKAQNLVDSQINNQYRNKLMQTADQSDMRTNRLAMIARDSLDPATGQIDNQKLKASLIKEGMFGEAQDFEKQDIQNRAQTRLEASEKIKSSIDLIDYGIKKAGMVRDQAGLDSLRQEMESLHEGASNAMPTQYTPEGMAELSRMALSEKDKIILAQQKLDREVNQANSDRDYLERVRGHDIQQSIGLGANSVAGGKNMFEAEQKLNADYQAESKNFVAVRDAYKRLQSALPDAHTSSPATLAAGTTFMKLLDPNSVVRESELAMSLNATGALDRALNFANTLANGKTLTEAQVKEFNDTASKLYSAAESQQNQLNDQYVSRAKDYGMNPAHVVSDYGKNEDDGANDHEYQQYLKQFGGK